ncbi:MAG: FAD-dependent oxidoreductase [Rhodospirillales bacterium]|nr:FAD-dependent oxidoreductase [Rhodospirillales bacterium]
MFEGQNHYVIIGNGVAGNEAAKYLREHDSDSRITIITAGRLLFYNRYELPRIFHEDCDWRDFLVNPPEYYEKNRIIVRRNSLVNTVDSARKTLTLDHKEEISYDALLVASGGRNYLPEHLTDSAHLFDNFQTFRAAQKVRDTLPKGGKVVMLGGDMIGLDLARNLVVNNYQVTVLASEQTFWPHVLQNSERTKFLEALEHMGIEVIDGLAVERVEEGGRGMSARKIKLGDGREIFADIVMSFYGLTPSVEFMLGSGVDIERGLLVNTHLQTTDKSIWAAGDVCQIWSSEENRYRFYYGWKNVKMMGEIAAKNMTGEDITIKTIPDENIFLNKKNEIDSPYWEYE